MKEDDGWPVDALTPKPHPLTQNPLYFLLLLLRPFRIGGVEGSTCSGHLEEAKRKNRSLPRQKRHGPEKLLFATRGFVARTLDRPRQWVWLPDCNRRVGLLESNRWFGGLRGGTDGERT